MKRILALILGVALVTSLVTNGFTGLAACAILLTIEVVFAVSNVRKG